MAWFLSPSGWPTNAIDSSLYAVSLAVRGWRIIDADQVPAAIAAYKAGETFHPAPVDYVDEDELAAALATRVTGAQLAVLLSGKADAAALAAVALSGRYGDLTGLPAIPSASDVAQTATLRQAAVEAVAAVDAYEPKTVNGARAVRRGELVVNAADYGTVGDGTADDTAALQAALTGGNRVVYVPAGTYRVTATLRLYAKTWLLLHPAATILNDTTATDNVMVFINAQLNNATYATGYTGDSNIRVTGGTIDCARRSARKLISEAFAFAHASNIILEQITMTNCYAGHFVEYNSLRDSVIRDCVFTGMDPGTSTNRDAINIDFAGTNSFPSAGAWDGTPCQNISIERCTFTTIQTGIASHGFGDATKPHRNIRIRDCVFTGCTSWPVHGMNWSGGGITGNRIEACQVEAINLQACIDVQCHDNVIVDTSLAADGGSSAVVLTAFGANLGSGCRVGPNRVTNTGATRFSKAYDVQTGTGHIVNTGMADAGSTALVVTDSGDRTVIDGVIGINLADDAATSVPVPGTNFQGLLLINTHSTVTSAARGLFWIRPAGGLILQSIAQIAAADLVLTTGIALAGTTGTDAKITLSAFNNRLYIENRSGASKRFGVQFIAG